MPVGEGSSSPPPEAPVFCRLHCGGLKNLRIFFGGSPGQLGGRGREMPNIPKPMRDPQFCYERKLRKCLRCGKEFTSEHRDERICPKCKASIGWKESYDGPYGQPLVFKAPPPP